MQMRDWSQQVWPQLHSFFLSPGSPAALAMKTPPRGLQPARHTPPPNGEPRSWSWGRVSSREVPPTAAAHWLKLRRARNHGQWWPEVGTPPSQLYSSAGLAGGVRTRHGGAGRSGDRAGLERSGGWPPGPQSRRQRAAEVAVAGSELRFLGRAPHGGRGRGRLPGRGRGPAQLFLFQPGLHVSRGACLDGRWGTESRDRGCCPVGNL